MTSRIPHPHRRPGTAMLVLGLCFGLATAFTAGAEAPLPVVASFSILGDLVTQVGGERVAVTTLVGPGGDAHVYAPTPADARTLSTAKLLVTNGLGFEGWIDRLVTASGFAGPAVVAAADVTPRRADADDPAAHGGDSDPHAWQDPANVALYVAHIRDGLIAADPAGEAGYRARADAYLAALDALDAEIRDAVAAIPSARRLTAGGMRGGVEYSLVPDTIADGQPQRAILQAIEPTILAGMQHQAFSKIAPTATAGSVTWRKSSKC